MNGAELRSGRNSEWPENLDYKFSEVMSGGFMLGVSDPSAGEQEGIGQGSKLVIRCEATVDDLESFVHDLQRRKALGTIHFPAFGTGIDSDRDVFHLFRPGEVSGEK